MNSEDNYGFEKIKISDKLDDIIKDTIKKASQDKKRKRIRINFIRFNAVIASLFAVFILSINISPAFAESINQIPIISSISNALLFHYDKNIINAEKQNVDQTKIDKGISITIDNIVSDDKDLFILYTLDGKMNKDDIKNLLLDDFTLKDASNNSILDSKDFKAQMLPEKLNDQEGDYIILSSKQYKCIVSSLGNSLESYSKNKKTYGSIELISLEDSSKIPNEISLNISSLTEVYNTNFSKEKNKSFISKFSREPIVIEGKWAFSIKIDDNLKLKKPEVYSDIKFSTNNTDFTLEYLKIYPTHISTKLKLGENKLDKSQCWSIGRIEADSKGKLPYLIDENGNKYFISGNPLTSIDSDKCIFLSFESCYFNKTKELYLVISQLNYMPGAPFVNIEPIKIKIK